MRNKSNMAFWRKNYILMIIAIVILLLGFIIMTLDKQEYGFGFLGITLGPIIVMSGFIIEFFAILANDKKKE